jgi:VWFA-related protein
MPKSPKPASSHPRQTPARMLACLLFALALISAQSTPPQNPPAATQPPANANVAETTARDEPAMFKAKVNLVQVPVVVRDRQGHAVGNLRQEDFQLFDKGKPQVITRFSVEQSGKHVIKEAETSSEKAADKQPEQALPPDAPDRFVAYLFDDVHLQFGDLARVRDAADRHLAESLRPADRAAIYTTSGQTQLDFTDDRAQLHETLFRLQPRPVTGSGTNRCPQMSYYMADLIINKNDPSALQAATLDVMSCMHFDPTQMDAARQIARSAAQQELSAGDHETRLSLGVLKDLVRRISTMPGQRAIVLVSPGFLTLADHIMEKTDVLDRAIRANVIISSLDARGLYVPGMDLSKPSTNEYSTRMILQYERQGASAQADVMAEMAAGTGGTFFQNNNDLGEGLKRVAAAPEYYYLLGFSPQNLKLDGSLHALKVTLKNPSNLSLQARHGYYAPKHLDDAVETARREIEEALFSREEMHDLPVDLQTQFFKSSVDKATVTVLTHMTLRRVRFRKENGRNRNDVTIVAALFDRNGVYVTGSQKRLEMRLLDVTLERRLDTGFTIRTTLDVKPGRYSVRLVVRDVEGQLMSAENGAVEIP